MSKRLRLLVALLVVVVAPWLLERTAAADRAAETAAKEASKSAQADHQRTAYNTALKKLLAAVQGCGDTGCTPATAAALLRDVGVMQMGLDEREKALEAFGRARGLDPKIALPALYATADVKQAWDSATPATPAAAAPQPAGRDFSHVPATAQQARTPLPIFVEPTTSEALASVVVRYKSGALRSFRRAPLKKMGSGWGGYVPCADVVVGAVTYYIQGFDSAGELVASAGDLRTTFSVPIRETIGGEPPKLPDLAPPSRCSDEELQALNLGEGERCQEDRQCKSGSCPSGRCKAAPVSDADAPSGPRQFARIWVGGAGTLDMTLPPARSNPCALAGNSSPSGYWCTTPGGADYPADGTPSSALVAGRGGNTPRDFTTGGVHITATIDYAINASLLVGLRFGYVAGAYPGSRASDSGKTIGPPLHIEARGTWLLGDEPLAHSGLAGYVFGGGGVARFDTPTTVQVGEAAIAGARPFQAWLVAGPAFAAVGGGARYAFSPRAAFSTGLGLDLAIGPGAFAAILAPEMNVQYGF